MDKQALHEYFIEQTGIPQKLGVVDCVKFVAGAVFVGWGRDYRDELGYWDRRSAVKRLRDVGGLKAACDEVLGDLHPISELEPGDVIWYQKPVPSIGLLMPEFILVKVGRVIHRLEIDPQLLGWKTLKPTQPREGEVT